MQTFKVPSKVIDVSIGDILVDKRSSVKYEVIPCPSNRRGNYPIYLKPIPPFLSSIKASVGQNRILDKYYELVPTYLQYDPTQQEDLDSDI